MNSIVPAVVAIGLLSSVTQADFAPEQCAAFGLLDFNLFAYDNYEKFFNEDSEVILSQAGKFRGPKAIKEYVRFADENSPYLERRVQYDQLLVPVPTGFDPVKGICKFSIVTTAGYVLSTEFTNGDTVNMVVAFNAYYSIPENIVAKFHIYYSTEFLEAIHTRVSTAPVFEFVCDTLTSTSCVDVLPGNPTLTKKKCIKRLSKLPLVEGVGAYFDSNTQGCRIFHAVFAAANTDHCSHVSLDPVEDSNRKIKCQVTENILPTDLFTDEDLARHAQVCADSPDVDASLCFRVIENPNPPTMTLKKAKTGKAGKTSKTKKAKNMQQ